MNKYIKTLSFVLFITIFVKFSYSGEIFFDYYGLKDIYNGQTVSGNENISITLPCEASQFLSDKDYNLDPNILSPLGNKTGVTIRYIPRNGSIFSMDRIVFRFQNIRLSTSIKKCWLIFHEYRGLDNNGDGIGDANYDLNKNGYPFDILPVAESRNDVSGSDTISFSVFTRVPPNAILYLACAEDNESIFVDKIGFYAEDFDTSYNPVFVIDSLYNKTEIYNKCSAETILNKGCLTVSAYACCGNEPIKDLEVKNPQCFIDMKCQFNIGMKPSISIIDISTNLNNATCKNSKSGLKSCFLSDPGYTFLEEYSGNILNSQSCTDRKASGGTIFIEQNEKIDDSIVLGNDGWRGKLILKFYDKKSVYACSDTSINGKLPYKALDFKNNRLFLDNNGKSYGSRSYGYLEDRILFKKGDFCLLEADVISNENCVENNTTICLKNLIWEDDIYVGITGKSRLTSIQWGLYMELNILKDDYQMFSIKKDEKAKCGEDKCCYDKNTADYFLLWKSGGEEVFLPYMLRTNQFKVAISNNSCWNAEIYGRIWDEKGRVIDDVYIGLIKANSVKILTGDEIFYKAKEQYPLLGKGVSPIFSAILLIGAPKRDIEVTAYDNRAGRTKMIPAYDLSSEEWTYRNIEFEYDLF